MGLTHLSLFTGIGGIDLAAEWAGFETVGQVEMEDFQTKVLEKHWPDVPRWRDVRDVTADSFRERTGLSTVDLISGGFPCQPFSVAGNRKGKEDDRYLWPEMLRVIADIRPTWVVAENVAGIISMEQFDASVVLEDDSALCQETEMVLETIREGLAGVGYDSQPIVVPAVAVGAIHRRDRIFIIANANSSGRMEYTGFEEEVQQSRLKELQRDESKQSHMSKLIHGFTDGSHPNSEHVEGSCIEKVQRERGLQGFLYTRSFEKWSRRSTVYQPKLCRDFNGVPGQVDRLKSLGNAVVPQQVYPILKAIADIENATTGMGVSDFVL